MASKNILIDTLENGETKTEINKDIIETVQSTPAESVEDLLIQSKADTFYLTYSSVDRILNLKTPYIKIRPPIINILEQPSLIEPPIINILEQPSFFDLIIVPILNNYKALLNDESSREYKLFKFLTSLMNSDGLIIFSSFFFYLHNAAFSLDELFSYFDDNILVINKENLREFLINIRELRIKKIKDLFYTNSYSDYGNLYTYLNSQYASPNSELFFHDDLLITSIDDYLIKPDINYLNIDYENKTSYNNLRVAEEAYWVAINSYKNEPDYLYITFYNKNISIIYNHLLNQNYGSLSYGIPVLMKKIIQKYEFFIDANLNNTMISIIRGDYRALSLDEVYYFLNEFFEEFINYMITEEYEDYLIDRIPKQSSFINFISIKITELSKIEIKDLDLIKNKRMKFYLYFIVPFIKSEVLVPADLVTLSELNISLNLEFSTLKEKIDDIRDYIAAKM